MRPGFDPCFGKIPWRRERLQYSHLENSMDCIVHGVSKSQTWLSNFHLKCLAVNTDDATRQVLSYSTVAKLLSRFSCVQLSVSRWTVARQAPLYLEFPRQGYWSGLSFPSPRDLPNSGIEPGFLALQADSLLSEPPGKSKNTGVGSLSLLQGIFPAQELNWDPLPCRQILHLLSYREACGRDCTTANICQNSQSWPPKTGGARG